MKSIMKLTLGVCAALALTLSVAGDASAAGLAVDANDLATRARTTLKADIDRAHAETPDLFRQVYDVAKRAGELDAASRRPGTPLTMHFKVLGPRALMPMLELLAFDGHAPTGLSQTALAALRVGLVEAVGIIRDARAVPVLARIVMKERDVDTTHASADALGRMGSDEAFSALVTALEAAERGSGAGGTDRVNAILAGVGSSRRLDGVKLLAKRLDARPDAVTARAIAKALGTAGNAWAWKTLPNRDAESAVREHAARSLVTAYVAYTSEARTAASTALLVVDAPQTPSLITEARRTASTDQRSALDDLSSRLSNNPTR